MKKILIIILLIFVPFCVFAKGKTEKKKTLDRTFEIGLLNIDVNFANSFLTVKDVFHEVIIIDLDKLSDGFKINLGFNIVPLYINYNSKKGWGVGLSAGVSAFGVVNLSGNMLSLSEAVKDNSDLGGAVFSSVTVNSFYDVKNLKIKFNPSLYTALAYVAPPRNMTSSVIYTLDYSNGTVMNIDYASRVYIGYSTENKFSITSNPGLDFTVGMEYPLAKEIGLTNILPILDFDVALDFINIPFIPSTLTDYIQVKGQVGKDTPIKLINKDDDDDSGLFSSDGIVKGTRVVQVSRPFKMLTRADWRPLFGTNFLTITPVIGFCYSEFYYQPFSFEGGLNASLNFGNIFLLKAGLNYIDRMFVNNLGVVLNSKLFEVDIGLDLRSQEISQLWSGAGFGLSFGFKFGW
jgi:hypothetical protein